MHVPMKIELALSFLLASFATSVRADDPAFQPIGVNAKGTLVFKRPRDGARVLWIPAGAFRMNQYHRTVTDEPPSRPLFVDGFAIDETEVTNRQFAAFLNDGKRERDEAGHALVVAIESGLEQADGKWRPCAGCEELPAVGATGWGALAFARWIGGDLPQLPEWQKAASGPEGLLFPWGNEPEPDALHCNWRRFGPGMPTPVGSYPLGASPYGALDMAGNVYERVYPGGGDRQGRAQPVMIRGGSWASPHPLNLRTFDLCMQSMEVADRTVGFRCVVREGKGLPLAPRETLRMARSWREAMTEARERNVPLLLSLHLDTCGQCDRTKAGLYRDPEFMRFVNENAVLLVGQDPGDAADHPHPEGKDGRCTLFPELTCDQHREIFSIGLHMVEQFVVSPGNFILDPRVSDEEEDASKRILVPEMELPKWGGGADVYVAKLKEAQAKLGAPISRAQWLEAQKKKNEVR